MDYSVGNGILWTRTFLPGMKYNVLSSWDASQADPEAVAVPYRRVSGINDNYYG